jgi:GNAT superfamily N-acetyltransferase
MIKFSRAVASDAELLLKVKIRAFAWDVQKYGMGPPNYDSLEDLLLAISKAQYYKISYNDTIVGGFSLYDMGNLHFELGSIYIDPKYQGKGIGQQAISYIEQIYPEVRKWTLDTPYLSFRNHDFYEKMGYIKIGEEKLEAPQEFVLFLYEKNIM